MFRREDELQDEIDTFGLHEVSIVRTLAFAEWMDINCVRAGEHEWVCRLDGFLKKYTTENLYNIFNKI